jgi:hypothetical protein
VRKATVSAALEGSFGGPASGGPKPLRPYNSWTSAYMLVSWRVAGEDWVGG